MAYNILIMGASYGSLLASKMLFGGHNDQTRLPARRGRPDQCGRLSRAPAGARPQGPGRDRFAQAAGQGVGRGPRATSNPADYDLVGLAMQEPQYRSPGVRELLDAVGEVEGAVHVDHEHAAAALHEAHSRPRRRDAQARLYRPDRVGQFRARPAHAVQPRSAGDPPAGGKGQRAAGDAADQLQGRALRQTTNTPRSCASSRTDIEAVRFDVGGGQDRAAGEAEGARFDLRAARQMGDAARRQLPLRHAGRHAHRAGSRAHRHRHLALGLQFRQRPRA